MLYSVRIDIPANTLVELPLRTVLHTALGVVSQVWVRWRWGSANLCGCQIRRNESPVWPTLENDWFVSSVDTTMLQDYYVVDVYPIDFLISAYNLDDTYPHALWIALNVIRPKPSDSLGEFLTYINAGG